MKILIFVFLLIISTASAQSPPYPPPTSSGITSLTGDVTATGPGAAAATVVQIGGAAIPVNAGAVGTNASGQLVSVTPGGGTTPGYPANQPVSGCGVEYVSGLTFTAGGCTYTIGGTQYTSVLTSITLAAADPSNPRIDVIIVDNTGTASAITGTPAASPAQPTVDYSTQLPLNLVLVNASATTPSAITTTLMYDENVEWACTPTTHINCASTNNPYHGTKDIEATAAVLGNNFTLVKPAAGTVDLSTQNTLILYIRSKAKWPSGNGNGANGLRTLSLFWLNSSTQAGLQVVLQDGAFGFSSSNITTYQQISIPISIFGTGSNLVTTLKAQVTGNGGSSSFGWYIDQVTLQSGQAPLSLPTTLTNFKGVWNSTANYNPNDTVTYAGTSYVALGVNTNKVPVTNNGLAGSLWSQLAGTPGVAVPAASVTLVGPAQIFICTTTCTVTVPVPILNYQFCVINDDNVATVITLSALGSSARYENTARTAYGTAGTGTLVSGGAVKDSICIVGRDSTHYVTTNFVGTWTAN